MIVGVGIDAITEQVAVIIPGEGHPVGAGQAVSFVVLASGGRQAVEPVMAIVDLYCLCPDILG